MRICFHILVLGCLFLSNLHTQAKDGLLQVRFMDTQTGYALQPDVIVSGFDDGQNIPLTIDSAGRAQLRLPQGDYTITVTASNYQSVASAVAVTATTRPIQFSLDPIIRPDALLPENIVPLRRLDATVYLGYVVSEASSRPIENLTVFSEPSGVRTSTDRSGYFKISVPLQSDAEWRSRPATLTFAKEDFITREHHQLQLVSNGDWILRVRMSAGTGTNVIDDGGKRLKFGPFPRGELVAMQSKETVLQPSTAARPTIRLPSNIRVLLTNGTVEYVSMETYTARSLSYEWFSSWGNYPGGMESLKAGSVAVRSYAAWFVNNAASDSSYDICATTACQVYKPRSTSNGDSATTQTAGYVLVGSNNAIVRSEYSAENNSMTSSCGDGFTQPRGGCLEDTVCSGEKRFGHGRGMCQWGTFKWATGLKVEGNGASYPTNANSGVLNGQPKRDWVWIVNHYYPELHLVHAMPLIPGDRIKIVGSKTRAVRMCADGGISSGINCDQVTEQIVGATGVITSGPVQVIADGKGFTWWKVAWSDGQVGWIPENWLERVIPIPSIPTNLRATPASPMRVNLTWDTEPSDILGYLIERRSGLTEEWQEIGTASGASAWFNDKTVVPATTNHYRVRACNLGGNSDFSESIKVVTPGIPPVLDPVPNRTVVQGESVTFTATATSQNEVTFSLSPGAPPGASIDPLTGVFEWTPTTEHGAGSYPVTLRVSDNANPPQSDTKTFSITVLTKSDSIP